MPSISDVPSPGTPEGRSPWIRSWRADPIARAIADRHYSRQKVGASQFVPPGRCLVLRTFEADALWVTSWPYPEYVQHAWPGAWVNSAFRNEGDRLSSEMIRWAVAHTAAEWPVPDLGMVTFIDPSKTENKGEPGYCYLMAGFRRVGKTKGGLPALQLLPPAMAPPAAAPEIQGVLL